MSIKDQRCREYIRSLQKDCLPYYHPLSDYIVSCYRSTCYGITVPKSLSCQLKTKDDIENHPDFLKKVVYHTLDDLASGNVDGVKIMHLADFLLM